MAPDTRDLNLNGSRYIGACSLSVAIGAIVGVAVWCSFAVAVAVVGQAHRQAVVNAFGDGALAGAPLGAAGGLVAGLAIVGLARNDASLLVIGQLLLLGLSGVLWFAILRVENGPVQDGWRLLPLAGQLLLSVAGLIALAWMHQGRRSSDPDGSFLT